MTDVPGDVAPPTITLTADGLGQFRDVESVALPFFREGEDLVLGPGGAELIELLGIDLLEVLARAQATGRGGDVVEHTVLEAPEDSALERVLLVGLGASTPTDFRRAGAALSRRLRGTTAGATTIAALADEVEFRAFVEGLVLGALS